MNTATVPTEAAELAGMRHTRQAMVVIAILRTMATHDLT